MNMCLKYTFKLAISFLLCITSISNSNSQIIPVGISKDSITIPELFSANDMQSFYLYKPSQYDPQSSPLWFVMHGTGGTGDGSINNLSSIADRRNALIVAVTLDGPGTTMIAQTSLIHKADSSDFCAYRAAGSLIMNRIYNYILNRETRIFIPCYLSGFSSGGQFVSRYMLIRQAYPDSIPFQMALSMSPIGYTLLTDTFLGVAQPWVCGTIFPPQPSSGTCRNAYKLYNWNCDENIIQYYNENYAVCVGDQDLASQLNGGCYDITGTTRLDRARTFFAFCDSNAISRGTALNWQYAEIPGAGHDEFTLFNTKYLPTDSSTIAESILFDTPYHSFPFTAPVAQFHTDTTTIIVNDTVFFTNTRINASSYYWDFGDSTFSNDINPYHIYNQAGDYTVELTAINSSGCDTWIQKRHYVFAVSGVGIDENNPPVTLSIFPTLASGTITIQSKDQKKRPLIIRNLLGQTILEMNYAEVLTADVSNWSEGIYFVQCGTAVRKLVVKK